MSDKDQKVDQVEALATATETLAQLVGVVQQRPAR